MRSWAFLLPVVATVMGCAQDNVDPARSGQQYCEELARIDCHVYWDCYDEAHRSEVRGDGLEIGTDKADCLKRLKAPCVATPFRCPEDKVYQEMKAGGCIRGRDGLTCADWTLASPPTPPACMLVCSDRIF